MILLRKESIRKNAEELFANYFVKGMNMCHFLYTLLANRFNVC